MLWSPSYIVRVLEIAHSSTKPIRVETNAAEAFLKVMGNPEGPHVLASEWVAVELAKALDMRTFQATIMHVDADDFSPNDYPSAKTGPAFATKAEQGKSWGGNRPELERIANKEDLTRLVVFDTWIRNRDRYTPKRQNISNVFLSTEQAPENTYELVIMDHTHAFGDSTRLSKSLGFIHTIKDDKIYGNFPLFAPFFDLALCRRTLEQMESIPKTTFEKIIQSIPKEWEIDEHISSAWIAFLHQRAIFLVDKTAEHFAPSSTRRVP